MHWQGILVGLVTFAIIGACHPLVIKVEYYFSARICSLSSLPREMDPT